MPPASKWDYRLARFRQSDFASIDCTMTYKFAKRAWHYRGLAAEGPMRRWLLRLVHGRRYRHTDALKYAAGRSLQFTAQQVLLGTLSYLHRLYTLQITHDIRPFE